jgi:sporulation protein YunB
MFGRRHRPKYTYVSAPASAGGPRRRLNPAALLCFALAALAVCSWLFLRNLSTSIAVSDACDYVTKSVNQTVNGIIAGGGYSFDYFMTLEKNADGQVVAASSNMAHINALSTEILDKVIKSTDSGALTVKIPLGNLTGMSLLMGRGPGVPVKIIYLTSSRVDFKNEISSAGINQTKDQLNLEITVDVDILVPWRTVSSQVVTEVMIADTVIVGQVPDTYVNVE